MRYLMRLGSGLVTALEAGVLLLYWRMFAVPFGLPAFGFNHFVVVLLLIDLIVERIVEIPMPTGDDFVRRVAAAAAALTVGLLLPVIGIA